MTKKKVRKRKVETRKAESRKVETHAAPLAVVGETVTTQTAHVKRISLYHELQVLGVLTAAVIWTGWKWKTNFPSA